MSLINKGLDPNNTCIISVSLNTKKEVTFNELLYNEQISYIPYGCSGSYNYNIKLNNEVIREIKSINN